MSRSAQLATLQSVFVIATQPLLSYFEMPTALRFVEASTGNQTASVVSKPDVSGTLNAQLERRPE